MTVLAILDFGLAGWLRTEFFLPIQESVIQNPKSKI
jgi:hypothetical protein